MPLPSPTGRPGRAAGHPRVALLAGYLDDEYEWGVWQGARRAIEERGGSVLTFAGAGIDDPSLERRARGRVFDLVDATEADGILCLSSVLGHHVGVPGMERWLLQRRLLTCSIGPAEHLPNVMVDDSSGVTQLMRHLIAQHAHRRIAFVTGSPSSGEAQRRLSAYIQVLSDHELSFDPRLTLTGDFTPESGVRAIRELLDARQIPVDALDAVVCSNDYMAFGAIEELARRGIAVPEQVAVVGFDDIAPSRSHKPSLTTVRQPLEELGRKGALRLLNLVDGGAAEGTLMLETELVLRRSCGCAPTGRPPPPLDPGQLVHQRALRFARVLQRRMFGPRPPISAALAELLPDFGIDACAVSELVPPGPGETQSMLKLVLGFDATTRDPEPSTFAARRLVPSAFSHLLTRSCLVLPLTVGAETLGIAVVPASNRDGEFYEMLGEQLSTVLKVQGLRRPRD